MASFRKLLSPTELTRADRYLFDKHRHSYIVSQAHLRLILSDYLNRAPEAITFSFGKRGKPFLSDSNLKFNMSHSHDYALYGLLLDHEIGVDIEYWRDKIHNDGIVKSNFSADEQTEYFQLPDDLKTAAFFQGWTCNEAFIKAIGLGLYFPLKDFSVVMDPTKPAALVSVDDPHYNANEWFVTMLDVPARYSAALMVEKSNEWVIETFKIN